MDQTRLELLNAFLIRSAIQYQIINDYRFFEHKLFKTDFIRILIM